MEKIGYFNETIGHVNEAIQSEDSERKNKTTMCADKDKKLRAHRILRANKRLWEYLKRKKIHGVVMFVSMNEVNNYELQH